jgi:hypothetical protein
MKLGVEIVLMLRMAFQSRIQPSTVFLGDSAGSLLGMAVHEFSDMKFP